ncbi:unnamed protein product, partial [Iphiclides podalirius]
MGFGDSKLKPKRLRTANQIWDTNGTYTTNGNSARVTTDRTIVSNLPERWITRLCYNVATSSTDALRSASETQRNRASANRHLSDTLCRGTEQEWATLAERYQY